jgi:GxxExxY protein
VIVEAKAVAVLPPVCTQQLLTYLKLADCRVGLLLNFGAPTMTAGIERVVNNFPE